MALCARLNKNIAPKCKNKLRHVVDYIALYAIINNNIATLQDITMTQPVNVSAFFRNEGGSCWKGSLRQT
jgi:hypothetical protein